MAPFALDAWLRPLGARVVEGRLQLLCPTAFHRDRVRERFLPLIERHLAACGGLAEVELLVAPRSGEPAGGEVAPAAAAAPGRASRERTRAGPAIPPLDRAEVQTELPYRFDNFVVGQCNALAREASLAIAQGRQQGANPLFLTSRAGLGKTHLARAIAAEAGAAGRVVYACAETFTNDFTASVVGRRMDQFKRRYRFGCRMLVLDDVHFLEAKRKTQLELFHTIAHLLDAGGRVVLTGDRLPRDMRGLDPRLRSQMAAGLVAELEPPDVSVRREILRRKAAAGGVRLPDACLELLVDSLRGSVRDLEAALIQLVASASLLKRPIDEALTRAALHKLSPREDSQALDPVEIVEAVAAFFRTRPELLAGRSRRRDVLWPRQLAMVLCRRHTAASHAEIGRLFGRQHTAVHNAVRVVERALLEHAPRRYQVEALTARIESLREVGAGR
jgi:chromosomal replication initiator protein